MIDAGADSATLLLGSDFPEWNVRVSPDGRWVAYVSNQSGTNQIYVRPFPSMDALTQISTDGGESPVWAHNGRELFYVTTGAMVTVVEYETEPTFRVTSRAEILDAVDAGFYRPDNNWRSFDVSAGDERLITLRNAGVTESADQSEVILIENFFTELRDRVGG